MFSELESDFLHNVDSDIHYYTDISGRGGVYTLETWNDLEGENVESGLFLLSLNIRSYNRHKDELIAMLSAMDHQPDILILTETWLCRDDLNFADIEGYEAYHTLREDGRGGGVSIYCSSKYRASFVRELSVCNVEVESCCAQIRINSIIFNVIGIYRPHSGTPRDFANVLEEILRAGNLGVRERTCIAGDFNINLLDENNEATGNLLTSMQSNHFVPLIGNPTRFPADLNIGVPTLIDHVWVNYLDCICFGVLHVDITDHCAVFMKMPLPSQHRDCKIKISFRDRSSANLESFEQEISRFEFNFNQFSNINDKVRYFDNVLNELYKKSCPLKIKYVPQKRLSKPWLTREVLEQVKVKSNYYNLFKRGIISRRVNNMYKNRCNSTIRQAKRNYFNNYFHIHRNDMKRYWAGISELVGGGRRNKTIDRLSVNNVIINDEIEMARIFNNYFAKVAINLEGDLPTPSDNTSPASLVPSNESSFYLYPVTPEECIRIVSKLKNVSYGKDCVSTKLFKRICHYVSNPLSQLINESFSVGIFPDDLKLAIITPIHKKGDHSNVINYRPVSVLSLLSKVFEKAFANRMEKFLNKFNIITSHQFGFRKGKGTSDALSSLTDYVYEGMNDKKHTVALFVDLCKAYDTVDHSILLSKLYKYGFRGCSYRWLESYLRDRQHCVKVGSAVSSRVTVNISIPQGSVLGCTLFSIYINDIPFVSDILKPILFADDTVFLHSHVNFEQLVQEVNLELRKVDLWLIKNRLTLNVDKTVAMLFSNRRSSIDVRHRVCISNRHVIFDCKVKYLGVTLDDDLSFKEHINNLCSRVAKNIGVLYRVSHYVPIDVILKMYYALIYPYLTYCVLVWGGSGETQLNKLLILQKKVVRILTGSEYLAHSEPLFHRMSILKISDIYSYVCLVTAHRVRGTFTVAGHHHEIRNSSSYYVPTFQRLSISQRALDYVLPYKYNNIPTHLKENEKLSKFKKSLKQYLIDKYQQ